MDSVFIKPNMMTCLNRSSGKVFDYYDGPIIPNVDDILLNEMAFHKSEVLYDCFNGITIDGIKVIKNTQLKDRKYRVNTLSKTKFEKLRKELRSKECVWQHEKDWLWNNTNQQYECSTPLLGEYIPEEKKVVLYVKNVEDACGGDKDLFSYGVITTYIHELFHAAHHEAAHNARRPYDTIREIEEAMTEFSTLLFLNEMSSDSSKSPKWKETFNWAEEKIKEKQRYLGSLPAYGFGYCLYNTLLYCNKPCSNYEGYKWIEKYYQKVGAIGKTNRYVKWYQQMLNPVYPHKDEKLCLELLRSILF